MLQIIIELNEVDSIKEKRRIVLSIKDKLHKRYRLSVAEVDLQDSLSFSQIGAAYVSNSRKLGESVLQKALSFVENMAVGRIQDAKIYSEQF